MSAQSKLGETYVTGPSTYRTLPRFETKPSSVYGERGGALLRDSGGGYERFRSWEVDPTSTRDGKGDVYVSHHRLLAVAWCYPDDWSVGDILADLHGKDVHHNAPELDGDRGVEWDNRECVLEVLDHGHHSEITQAEKRAYAEDDRRRATGEVVDDDAPACGRCGATDATLCRSDDWEGYRCIDCSKADSDGAEIEVLHT